MSNRDNNCCLEQILHSPAAFRVEMTTLTKWLSHFADVMNWANCGNHVKLYSISSYIRKIRGIKSFYIIFSLHANYIWINIEQAFFCILQELSDNSKQLQATENIALRECKVAVLLRNCRVVLNLERKAIRLYRIYYSATSFPEVLSFCLYEKCHWRHQQCLTSCIRTTFLPMCYARPLNWQACILVTVRDYYYCSCETLK